MKRVIGLLLAALATLVLLYLSRFWFFSWWDRPGLFELKSLPPQGGLLARWLRGTDFSSMELVIWAVGAFLVLTALQKIFDAVFGAQD
ncbi:MAG: hypothetical protein AAGF28_00665 [Pseudomonadota bacterium]